MLVYMRRHVMSGAISAMLETQSDATNYFNAHTSSNLSAHYKTNSREKKTRAWVLTCL